MESHYGSTASDEWSFDTLTFDPPYPSWKSLGGSPPTGTPGTDFLWTGTNNMMTVKALVAAADNRMWFSTY